MHKSAAKALDTLTPVPVVAPEERRRNKRVRLNLLGRFMRANKQEYPCQLMDISVGGASLLAPCQVEEGEWIVAYIDQIGRVEGRAVRRFDCGFAMAFKATRHKREKLAAQLTWLINRDTLDMPDGRRFERILPQNSTSQLHLPDGRVLSCRVIDVSIGGALIAVRERPPIGTRVQLGKLKASVIRHDDYGVALQFDDIQKPAALRRHFG